MGGLFDALFIIGSFIIGQISLIIYTLYSFEYLFIKRDTSVTPEDLKKESNAQKLESEQNPQPENDGWLKA